MTWILVRKLLRDVLIAWLIAAALLFLFQVLWSRITERVTGEIFETLGGAKVDLNMVKSIVFGKKANMPGQMIQAVIGGDNIQFDRASDMMSISYVHPLVITILSLWAIGRAANAIAGEIDRGTMELLLAQPIQRSHVMLAHLLVDAIVFPALCLVIWSGTYLGTYWMGLQTSPHALQQVDPFRFLPALPFLLGLLFAVSGVSMWISSLGRSRPRVWGWAVSVMFSMFLVNVLGQIWADWLGWLRPLTIFYHYRPQPIILDTGAASAWSHLLVLVLFGACGYALAWFTFCRRDLPAPL